MNIHHLRIYRFAVQTVNSYYNPLLGDCLNCPRLRSVRFLGALIFFLFRVMAAGKVELRSQAALPFQFSLGKNEKPPGKPRNIEVEIAERALLVRLNNKMFVLLNHVEYPWILNHIQDDFAAKYVVNIGRATNTHICFG